MLYVRVLYVSTVCVLGFTLVLVRAAQEGHCTSLLIIEKYGRFRIKATIILESGFKAT